MDGPFYENKPLCIASIGSEPVTLNDAVLLRSWYVYQGEKIEERRFHIQMLFFP